MDVTHPSHLGTTVFDAPEEFELTSASNSKRKIPSARSHGIWRPPARIAEFLPEGFSVPLVCYIGRDGMRRIVPNCTWEELIDLGAIGGLAVIRGMRRVEPESLSSYRAMELIHQYVRGRAYCRTRKRGMKEHLMRRFNYSRDLFVRRLGRLADSDRNVLPDDCGVTHQGKRSWTASQLTQRGRQAARDAGHVRPNKETVIAYGLVEAAKLNPLDVDPKKVRTLIRTALFDIESLKKLPSEELLDVVASRLLDAIEPHLSDARTAFESWFWGPKSSLIKQVAQRKNAPGGQLDPQDVRRALLELGWRAYEYVGQCIHALLRTIKNSIPEPLTDEEKTLFEHMHESQPYYGNLPAALLTERMPTIGLAVQEIWLEPYNQENVRVLHRLLYYFADMAPSRRAADRRSKKRTANASDKSVSDSDGSEGPSQNESHTPPKMRKHGNSEFIENCHSPATDDDDLYENVAEDLRQRRQIRCPAGCMQWDYRSRETQEDSITIRMRCACGRVDREITMTRKERDWYAKEFI